MEINKVCKVAANKIINQFVVQLSDKYEKKLLDVRTYDETLFFCADLLDCKIIDKNNKIKEIIFFILEDLKRDIYEKKYYQLQYRGEFNGLKLFAYCLSILQGKGMDVDGFVKFFNMILRENTKSYMKRIEKMPLELAHYDIVSGVAGTLNYMLDNDNEKDSRLLNTIVEYLIKLTKKKLYMGKQVIGFHIEREQQYLEKERNSMCNGNVNFGLAHGMVGVLIVLTKYRWKGYQANGIEEAIKTLFCAYERFTFRDNGICKYPTQLPVELYISGENASWSFNSGWCYGNSGVARGLMKSAYYLKDYKRYQSYQKDLLDIVNQSIEKYNLEMPILCHGYASIIAIQISAYKESGNTRFLDTLDRNVQKVIEKNLNYQEINERYKDNLSILQGAGGVVLTLLDALDNSLEYKKLLLI